MRKLRDKSGFTNDKEVVKSLYTKVGNPTLNSFAKNQIQANVSGALINYSVFNQFGIATDFQDNGGQSFTENSLNQIKTLTTDFGIKQQSEDENLNIYALEDNAMALVIMCEHFELTKEKTDLELIDIYLGFIQYCLQPSGYFYKYVDNNKNFTKENNGVNLADTTGYAIWALGYLISKKKILPASLVEKAESMFHGASAGINKIHSIYAISLIVKGLYYNNTQNESIENVWMIKKFAKQIVDQYKDVEREDWKWFQRTVSVQSSIISEALLCAWKATGEPQYYNIAKTSFDFLLSKLYRNIETYSSFLTEEKMFSGKKSTEINTIIFGLNTFYKVFKEERYLSFIQRSSEWMEINKSLSVI